MRRERTFHGIDKEIEDFDALLRETGVSTGAVIAIEAACWR
jgi:hypothetical protein